MSFVKGSANYIDNMTLTVCTPKEEGGLGFHGLKSFNLALLAKQG